MKVAVVGCAHGELEKIYDCVEHLEKENDIKVNLLLCCGDFQATRNVEDLECMAVPPKFRDMCTFYKYYSGEKIAPILTIFIGGNHEASNHLQELPYGGWVAPNIYYLGYAGVIEIGGLRIAGISGIFKANDFFRGHYECPPYSNDTLRSCYHIRSVDVFRLKQLSQPIDIFLSHDWPEGVYNHGNVEQLLKVKPFFKNDIYQNQLGSKPTADLLKELKPSYWFSAHLHVKFPALIKHENGRFTKFLALDKCLPRRKFLQILDIPDNGDLQLKYDLEWIAILQLTNHLASTSKTNAFLPGPGSDERWKFTPTAEEKEATFQKMMENLKIPENFVRTAAVYEGDGATQTKLKNLEPNPQTKEFCNKIGVDDIFEKVLSYRLNSMSNLSSDNDSQLECTSFINPSDNESPSNITINSRTPLKLPAPRIAEEFAPLVPPMDQLSPKPVSFSTPTLQENKPTSDVDSTQNDADSGQSGSKRFKRRNVAIYSILSKDDE